MGARQRFAACVLVLCAATAAVTAWADDILAPPPALTLENVPPVPSALARALEPYGDFHPNAILSWHPTRREMLVRRRLASTNQVHLVTEPGATPQPLTDFPNAVASASFHPHDGAYFIFPVGEGGNEVYRLHRFDMATRTSTPISPEGERAGNVSWNRKGDRITYTTVLVDRNNPDRTARTSLHSVDPLDPRTDRVLVRLQGGGWEGFRFSRDGRKLAFIEEISANQSHVWMMDMPGGTRRRVSRAPKGELVSYRDPHFMPDGKSLLVTSDRGSEFRQLVQLDIATGKEKVLTARHAHDVDEVSVSAPNNRVAFTTNENGSHVLRFLDLKTLKELPRPALVDGVISGLRWRRGSQEIAFSVTSARSSGDVFSYDVGTNQVTRWTNGNNPAVNTSAFPEPHAIAWKSFDAREITGFLYAPPKRFEGKRPVIVNIHGGPESQARAGFLGRNNYFVTELGIAMIYPNVRGSSGFGKTFLKLDNGRLREDSVKDIGALLDWIARQPGLDADRVMVMGGSYGGYMVLAVATLYPERIAGTVDIVGISNWVTLLEHTESYRRDLRRVEYGDERDPATRAFLERISPLGRADRIGRPLFVVHGRNDPRVPYTEAEQIVAAVKQRGTPVWFMLAADEGHGFVKKPNVDYLACAIAEFARRTLLEAPQAAEPPAAKPGT